MLEEEIASHDNYRTLMRDLPTHLRTSLSFHGSAWALNQRTMSALHPSSVALPVPMTIGNKPVIIEPYDIPALTGVTASDCHGPARDHASSLGQPAIPRLPTIEVGKGDVSLEAYSIEDLKELADVAMLWDVRDRATAEESRDESDG